jgi:Tfp pilus assembly protein FimT
MRAPWQRTATTTESRDGLTPTELLVVILVLVVALAIAVPVLLNR